MKTKVVIENGETTIVLTPENDFENDVIEKIKKKPEKFSIHTSINVDYSYSRYSNHNIKLSIKEERP